MTDISLKCDCGQVRGTARDIKPGGGTRVVCYCDSCQEFARRLGHEDSVLDEYGGTDIYQTAPARLTITEGREHIRSMKLTPKGPHRWYTGCCKSPIANTMTPDVPFAGVITSFMDTGDDRDRLLGPVGWYVQGKYARKPLPPGRKIVGFPFSLMFKLFLNLFMWKFRGLGKPNPFFNDDGTPVSAPEMVSNSAEE